MTEHQPPLSPETRECLQLAVKRAAERRQLLCEPEQLLEVLLRHSHSESLSEIVAVALAARAGVSFDFPQAELSCAVTAKVIPRARRLAGTSGSAAVEPQHVISVLLAEDSPVVRELRLSVLARLSDGRPAQVPEPCRGPRANASQGSPANPIGDILVPFRCGDDDYLVDRPDICDRIMMTLRFSSPLLVGPHGSGRRTAIQLLSRRTQDGVLPGKGRAMKLWSLDLMRLVAGTTFRGELEERLSKLASQLKQMPELPVLVIDNLSLLTSTGSGGGRDLLTGLLMLLKSGSARMVGSLSDDHFREHIESNPDLLNCLTPIRLDACDRDTAVRLLLPLCRHFRTVYGVAVSEAIVAGAVDLCQRHVPHHALPGAANLLLHDVAARLAFEADMLAQQPERGQSPYWLEGGIPIPAETGDALPISQRQLLLALSERHRIPFHHLSTGAEDKIRSFARAFKERVFGQDHVLAPLQKTVTVALSNLADPRRPLGRIFLVGPPGTGKTECALMLARHLMGRDEALLRFDMSEFSDRSGVSTLIGSDKGLIGSTEGGRLTEPLRSDPHRVVLFDEIEKAHPSIYDLFLQALDNGTVTDKLGNRVSFRHAFLVFTSNAGCAGETSLNQLTRAQLLARLGGTFRPEFLDRMEQVIPFGALDKSAQRRVAEAQLRQVQEQLEREYGFQLRWSSAVCNGALLTGADETGARHVLRWIHEVIKPAVAGVLLNRQIAAVPYAVVQLRVGRDGAISAKMIRRRNTVAPSTSREQSFDEVLS